MLKIRYSNKFKKDYEMVKKRGYDTNKLKEVINLLAMNCKLPAKYKEHYLVGNYKRLQRMSYSTRLVINIYSR